MKFIFCLVFFMSIQFVHADKKGNALKLINIIAELPILKWGNEDAYMHGFYLPIREYSEAGNLSVVELRTAQREIMYRCEMNNETALLSEILIYTSFKTDTYASDNNATYEVKPYMRIQLTYMSDKIQTILYKPIEWGEDRPFEEMAVEYTSTGMIKRIYHTKPSDYGAIFEAYYSNNCADSINIGSLDMDGKFNPFSVMRAVYDAKGNVITHQFRYLDGTYFETHVFVYSNDGLVQEWYKRKYSPTGSTKEVFGYVFAYENSKVAKANYYFNYVTEQDGKLEDVKHVDNLRNAWNYTYLPNGNLIMSKDTLETHCVIADVTTTYTLDAKGMVLAQKTVTKSKYKCKY